MRNNLQDTHIHLIINEMEEVFVISKDFHETEQQDRAKIMSLYNISF